MEDDIIGMREMEAIFSVTDELGIDREIVSVPLGKEDPGSVARLSTGEIEIIVPRTEPVEEWVDTLRETLVSLGFTPSEQDEE